MDSSSNIIIQKKTNRCVKCRIKLGPAGGTVCRCGELFCSSHIDADCHSCSYDYKLFSQSTLLKQLQIPELISTGRLEKL